MWSLEDVAVSVLPDGPHGERNLWAGDRLVVKNKNLLTSLTLEPILLSEGYGSVTPATTNNPHFIVKISDMMNKLTRFWKSSFSSTERFVSSGSKKPYNSSILHNRSISTVNFLLVRTIFAAWGVPWPLCDSPDPYVIVASILSGDDRNLSFRPNKTAS